MRKYLVPQKTTDQAGPDSDSMLQQPLIELIFIEMLTGKVYSGNAISKAFCDCYLEIPLPIDGVITASTFLAQGILYILLLSSSNPSQSPFLTTKH